MQTNDNLVTFPEQYRYWSENWDFKEAGCWEATRAYSEEEFNSQSLSEHLITYLQNLSPFYRRFANNSCDLICSTSGQSDACAEIPCSLFNLANCLDAERINQFQNIRVETEIVVPFYWEEGQSINRSWFPNIGRLEFAIGRIRPSSLYSEFFSSWELTIFPNLFTETIEVFNSQHHLSTNIQVREELWPNASRLNREAVSQLLRELLQTTESSLLHFQSYYFEECIDLKLQSGSDFWKPGLIGS